MRTVIFLVTISFCLSSCNKQLSITSRTYTPLKEKHGVSYKNESVPPDGLIYYLPKNRISLDITYSIIEYTRFVNGKENPEKFDINFSKPIEVSTTLIADKEKAFLVDGQRMTNNFWLKATLDFNLFPTGLVKSIDANIEDQSTEFAKNIVMTSGKLAKTFISPVGISKDVLKSNSDLISESIQFENKISTELSANNKSVTDLDWNNGYEEFISSANLSNSVNFESTFELITEFETDITTFKNNIIERLKNPTDHNYYLNAINHLNEEIIKSKKKDDLDFLLAKIKHFKDELKWFYLNNRVDEKSYDIEHNIEFDLDDMNSNSSKYFEIEIHPTFLFEHLLDKYKGGGEEIDSIVNDKLHIPKIKVRIKKNIDGEVKNQFEYKEYKEIDGLVVRQTVQTPIELLINGEKITSASINLAQLGYEAVIPLNSRRGGQIQTNVQFDETTGAVKQHRIQNVKSSIDQINDLVTQSGETLTETYDYLKYEKPTKELQRLIDLKGKLDELIPSESQNITDEIALIQNQINLINIQTQLKELLEEIEKKSSSEDADE